LLSVIASKLRALKLVSTAWASKMVPYCKLLIVLTCCAWHESFIFAAADSVFQVPLVNLMDLESLGSALEFGLIAIKADTNLATVRHGALEGLCNCVLDSDRFLEINGANQAQLSDGMTTRTSFPTATMGTTPLPLPLQLGSTCGPDTVAHMEELRDEVAVVAQQFVDAVDGVLASRTPHGAPLLWTSHGASYLSVASIVKASTNLEHFHVYSKKAETFGSQEYSFETVDTALGLHMDAGLFLAFVPGFDCSNHGDDDSLYVSVDGKVQRAVFPPGSVAIMLGVGAESWLTPSIGRATRHAVRMSASQRRAWYGMSTLLEPIYKATALCNALYLQFFRLFNSIAQCTRSRKRQSFSPILTVHLQICAK
jgi:hypothetical protein